MTKKVNQPEPEEETVEQLTSNAMLACKDAYYKYIEQDGTEPAFWAIRIEATHLSQDWKSLFVITFDDNKQFESTKE